MKKLFILIIIVTLTTFACQNLFAQNLQGRFNKNKFDIKILKLTEEQTAKFSKIRFEHKELKIDLAAKLQKNKLEFEKEMSFKDINKSNIMDLVEKGNSIRAEMRNTKIKMWFDLFTILDDNQKTVWKNNLRNFDDGGFGNIRHSKRDLEGGFGSHRKVFKNRLR